MNFFEAQERAKKKTFVLVLYFILAIIAIIGIIDSIVVGALLAEHASSPFIDYNGSYEITQGMVIFLFVATGIVVSPILLVIILLGTLFKIIALRGGGISVAKMVKATPIDENTKDFKEKQLVNIVQEMSIASGVSVPKLFVMEKEPGINAFVAGVSLEDMVMVVTQGALDQLDRDELQGVIGHEFSHILNSDMRINLRLMGILAGIIFLSQAGYFILRFSSIGGSRSSSRNADKGRLAIFLFGLGLFLVGYIGLFFGRVIKAAIARQRETLADASSCQFTRNPQGLINALKKIQASESGTYLKTKYVEDISHMCFCSSRWMFFQNLLATHPPLEERIKNLESQE